MTQPEPQQLESAFAPVEVIRPVASALVARGFVVVVSDADAGVLTMVRSRPPKGNAALLTCNWMAGSIADVHGASTLTISLSARSRGDSASAVVVSTRTLVSFPGLSGGALAMPDSEDKGASNGTAEAAVVSAIAKWPAVTVNGEPSRSASTPRAPAAAAAVGPRQRDVVSLC